ncbi:MAG: acyl carrier protein [Treponema sp.]|jgi:acyl carrier protein|nr:acyl carrier protein [Treponema sp.]HBB43751.1 acyl carrier protein [Treponema sp.]
MTKEEIFDKLKSILVTEFEVDEAKITPAATMGDDLDLDSIDFIDMIGKMKEFIPGKVSPDAFKAVKTLQDVVDTVYPMVSK